MALRAGITQAASAAASMTTATATSVMRIGRLRRRTASTGRRASTRPRPPARSPDPTAPGSSLAQHQPHHRCWASRRASSARRFRRPQRDQVRHHAVDPRGGEHQRQAAEDREQQHARAARPPTPTRLPPSSSRRRAAGPGRPRAALAHAPARATPDRRRPPPRRSAAARYCGSGRYSSGLTAAPGPSATSRRCRRRRSSRRVPPSPTRLPTGDDAGPVAPRHGVVDDRDLRRGGGSAA